MSPTPTIEDLEKDVAAKAQAVSDAQASHAAAVEQLQAAKDAAANPPASETATVPVMEVVPAPAPATPPPVLVPFDQPMQLVTKNEAAPTEPTPTYDPSTGSVVSTLPLGTPFKAIGKYETEHGVYFSDGQLSVKTVDLGHDTTPADTAPPSDDQGEKIPVHVTPADPNKWKVMSKKFMNPVQYRVRGYFTVKDLERLQPDINVTPDTHSPDKEGLEIAGKFKGPDNLEYYRTQSSVDNDTWYGFPVETLQPLSDPDDLTVDDLEDSKDLFNAKQAQATEVVAGYGKAHKAAAAAGSTVGFLSRFKRSKA